MRLGDGHVKFRRFVAGMRGAYSMTRHSVPELGARLVAGRFFRPR
jgi:hypothetical protein